MHKPAGKDRSAAANAQRVAMMRREVDTKFAASGEARTVLLASHPHRLLSIKGDTFWGFDTQRGGQNLLAELLMELRAGYFHKVM